MATTNSANIKSAGVVSYDGAGTFSGSVLTQHAVLVGGASNAITSLSVGATGTLLVGATSADPAFATSAVGDFTFTSATSGATRTLTISNTSNTASSAANLLISTAGTSAGSPTLQLSDTTQVWTIGTNTGSSSALQISSSATLGTNNALTISTAGMVNKPLQCAFMAFLGTTDSTVTGDGTSYTLGQGNALTKSFDQGTNITTGGTFTAPVAGRYHFACGISLGGLGILFTTFTLSLVTTGQTINGNDGSPANWRDSSNNMRASLVAFVNMAAGDTATLTLVVSGSTKTVNVIGSTAAESYFSGYLAC